MRFTDQDKRSAALKEALYRRLTFPAWVKRGVISKAEAERQIAVMSAIAEDYRAPDLRDQGSSDA